MIGNKKINTITAVLLSILICFTIVFLNISYKSEHNANVVTAKSETKYASKLFGTDIINIEIIADQVKWDEMLKEANKETYIMADVIVNGEKIKNVGVRLKGNSSLSQIAMDDTTDRYSFRIKFDEYIDGQTCFGLDSISLNNVYNDNTYMKEYISFDIMNFIGVDTPLYGYSEIKVNGKDWGFYLAIESYNDSYLNRTYSDTSGNLYSVKTSENMGQGMGIGNADLQNMKSTKDISSADSNEIGTPKNGVTANDDKMINAYGNQEFDFAGGMGGFGQGGGSDLVYTDDNPDNYSNIFDNAISTKTDKNDYKKVIKALKYLSTGTDLEKYYDVDKILRYLAAHTVVVNLDSYSSSMSQNYVIYEKDGKLTILPWDYGLSFGAMNTSDSSAVINFPIDTPVSSVDMADRPLIEKLFENKDYLNRYHKYLKEIMDGYFSNGKFDSELDKLDTLIKDYVKNDASAFITYDQYTKAVDSLKKLGDLRAESIIGQLDGTIPCTTQSQKEHPEKLISSEEINMSDLGTGMGGGIMGGGPGNTMSDAENGSGRDGMMMGGENMPDQQVLGQAMQIIQDSGGKITEEVKTKLKEQGITDEQMKFMENMGYGVGGFQGMGQGMFGKNNEQNTGKESLTNYLLISGLMVLLILTTFVVSKVKRRF